MIELFVIGGIAVIVLALASGGHVERRYIPRDGAGVDE